MADKSKQSQSETFRFASLTAHQLQSPITAVKQLLETLSGDYAGPMNARQKDLIVRAAARCDQGLETIERMLAVARAAGGTDADDEATEIASVIRKAFQQHSGSAYRQNITLLLEIEAEPVYVRGHEPSLAEALNALLGNALKYTPDNGRVRMALGIDAKAGAVRVSVADSGVGIPAKARRKVFEPFFRTPGQRESTRPGTGLGLTFAKAMIARAGGKIHAAKADLGGAEIIMDLPLAELSAEKIRSAEESRPAMRVVIVGGVAAGPKAASKIIRLMPDAQITIVDKGKTLFYAGCGLPYYVSGVVKEQRELMATPVGATRNPVFFQSVSNVRVMDQTEAIRIDRKARRLRVREMPGGAESWLEYDKLILATGSTPTSLSIPGADLANIFSLHGPRDAEGIKSLLIEPKSHDVVIVGGGLIGVEATEALVQRGCRVTIVEQLRQILPMLDWEIARLVEKHMESRGVKILTATRPTSFEGREGSVCRVITDKCVLPAEMVIVAVGVRPAVELAGRADLEIGTTGAMKVDDHMRTADPDIYAAGDCVETVNLVTAQPCYMPLGSTANKQGRVVAVNICGGDEHFPGVLGSTICKVFDYCVARTGLTEAAARQAGYDVTSVLAPAPDKEHFMPDARALYLKIVVDSATRRLLGAQVTGPGAGDKRIEVAAMAITAGMTVDQIANADLCYAPPYSLAMDNIIIAANIARNKLDGLMAGLSPVEVHRMLREGEDFVFLDVRSPNEYERTRLGGATFIPLGSLRGRLDELPRDKRIVTFCEISLHGYEAALMLRAAGFKDVHVMDGGVAMWPYEKYY